MEHVFTVLVPDASNMVSKNLNLSKDGHTGNEQGQGKAGMKLSNKAILPSNVIFIDINLEKDVRKETGEKILTGPLKSPAARVSTMPAIGPAPLD